jgi:hypothetical protein
MPPESIINLVCYGAAFLGALYLFAMPFTAQGRVAPRWIRIALWLSCPIALVWSLIGSGMFFACRQTADYACLSYSTCYFMGGMKTLFGGMGIGILVLMLASGEFMPAFSRKKK